MDILFGLLEALDLLGNLACAPFAFACAIAGAVIGYVLGGGGALMATGAASGLSLGLWLDFGVGAAAKALRWPVGLGLVAATLLVALLSVVAGGQ